MCECNSLSLETANTGIASLSAANSTLNASGAVTVITAGPMGGKLRSLVVKALQQTSAGMVRIFVTNGVRNTLIDEIRIPAFPIMRVAPLPTPVLQMFAVYKVYNLTLGPNDVVCATTQNGEQFNVIGEGINISQPDPMPEVCCTFKEDFPTSGFDTISAANTSLNGNGTIKTIFTAPNQYNGVCVDSISISALESTQVGMIRLFLNVGGGLKLFNELPVPATVQSSLQPAFKMTIPMNFNISGGAIIAASTQIGQQFSIAVRGKGWRYA